MTMTPIVRHRMRITLFVLFVATFGLTVVATIWAFLLQAGAFGTPSVTEVKHLGTLITGVIVEVVAGVIALWYDLFGLRQTQATAEEQPVPEYFERKLTNCVVAIRKGNILECHSPANAVVYPANVYFDTTFDDDIVDPKRSTLGMYLAERVGKGSLAKFDAGVAQAIADAGLMSIGTTNISGKAGRVDRFQSGAAIALRFKSDYVILLALTELAKPTQRYVATLDEQPFVEALSCFWKSIERLGVRGDLYMPVVGSGFGRINPQSALAHILLSFRAAAEQCKGRLCDKLIVVVYDGNWGNGSWVRNLFTGLFGDKPASP